VSIVGKAFADAAVPVQLAIFAYQAAVSTP
jgi:hypothetical protein